MAVNRYSVIDADGVAINTILVDERVVGYYTPGYGSKLVYLGPAVDCAPALVLNYSEAFVGMEALTIQVDGKPVVLEHGDKINLTTLAVTKKPPEVIDGGKDKP